MTKIRCSIKEFNRFLGPRIRNVIQSMTKKRKRGLGYICQTCKKKKELEAAHIKGNERKRIIEEVLSKYIVDKNKKIIEGNLENIEKEIIDAHKPIDKYFKFLCSKCHTSYDKLE